MCVCLPVDASDWCLASFLTNLYLSHPCNVSRLNPELMGMARDRPQLHLLSAGKEGHYVSPVYNLCGCWGPQLWSSRLSILSTKLDPQTNTPPLLKMICTLTIFFPSFFQKQLEPEIASLVEESWLLKSKGKGWPLPNGRFTHRGMGMPPCLVKTTMRTQEYLIPRDHSRKTLTWGVLECKV